MTLRKLTWMSEGRQVDEWNRTSLVCAILANANRDPRKRPRPYEVRDFHPFMLKEKKRPKPASFFFKIMESLDGKAVQTVTEADEWAANHQTL